MEPLSGYLPNTLSLLRQWFGLLSEKSLYVFSLAAGFSDHGLVVPYSTGESEREGERGGGEGEEKKCRWNKCRTNLPPLPPSPSRNLKLGAQGLRGSRARGVNK